MKMEMNTLEDMNKLVKFIRGVDCHTFRESELYRLMYGEIYKLDYVIIPHKSKVIVCDLPEATAWLLKKILEGAYEVLVKNLLDDKTGRIIINDKSTPSVVFIPFTDVQEKAIVEGVRKDYEIVLKAAKLSQKECDNAND